MKDHYVWKLYRHFWQFANCEIKEEENFKHWCRCVTVVRKLAVNLTQSIILWIPGPALQMQKSHQRISRSSQKQEKGLLLDLKCNEYTCARKVKKHQAVFKHSQQVTERQKCHNLWKNQDNILTTHSGKQKQTCMGLIEPQNQNKITYKIIFCKAKKYGTIRVFFLHYDIFMAPQRMSKTTVKVTHTHVFYIFLYLFTFAYLY